MYQPPAFREDRLPILHEMIRAHPLATLITAGPKGLQANLLPFTLHEAGPRGILRAHLARANPQLEALRLGAETLVVFQGPQAYISPAWYPAKKEHGRVVPTWNYIVVQVRGTPQIHDDPVWLRAQVEELTRTHESPRPKPWQVGDAPESYIDALLQSIAGLEIRIASIDGKWKMSQNRSHADRQGVREGLLHEARNQPAAQLIPPD